MERVLGGLLFWLGVIFSGLVAGMVQALFFSPPGHPLMPFETYGGIVGIVALAAILPALAIGLLGAGLWFIIRGKF